MAIQRLEVRARPRREPADAGEAPPRLLIYGLGAVLAISLAVAARFVALDALWLDEALTVNIARLPLSEIPEALRRDGSPPLYYVLLHFWMAAVGTGDTAVRALSGVFSVATLPVMWLAGRRLAAEGQRWVPAVAVLLLASSPFAIRYATEARMYSLVVLLVVAGFLFLDTILDRVSGWAAVGLAVTTGLLLLTHYWSMFLILVVAAMLFRRWLSADPATRPRSLQALAAMAAGALLFLPWLPSFLAQLGTTGAPWGEPAGPRVLLDVVLQFAGGLADTDLPLGLLLLGLFALGLFGAAVGPGAVLLDLRGRRPARSLAAVAGLSLGLSVAVTNLTGTAFAFRHAAVVLPLVLLVAALGASTLSGSAAGPAVVAVAVVLGLVTAVPNAAGTRTSADDVADVLLEEAEAGDVVAYCPDQLGPSVSRLLERGGAPALVQLTFPRAAAPHLVDWRRYEEVNEGSEPVPFARMLLERAGAEREVWVVWSPGYRTFGSKCQALLTLLRQARPGEERVVAVPTDTFERLGLVRYPPG